MSSAAGGMRKYIAANIVGARREDLASFLVVNAHCVDHYESPNTRSEVNRRRKAGAGVLPGTELAGAQSAPPGCPPERGALDRRHVPFQPARSWLRLEYEAKRQDAGSLLKRDAFHAAQASPALFAVALSLSAAATLPTFGQTLRIANKSPPSHLADPFIGLSCEMRREGTHHKSGRTG